MSEVPLTDLSRYIYGTTRLGDNNIPFEDRVAVARQAIDAGLWIHTSHQYGDALKVLRAAIDQNRSNTPKVIYKIGWDSVDQIRDQIRQQIDALGLDFMDIGQLCLGGKLAEAFRDGSPAIDALNGLKEEGIVGRFVLETWPWTSEVPLAAIRVGHASTLVDALIFYLNPLQRFVSNDLWDELVARAFPIVAMRTVAGGSIERLTAPNGGGPDYLRKRATDLAPIFDRAGCATWTEFCIRFALGYTPVRATVGSTSHRERLSEFIDGASVARPLSDDIRNDIERLQRTWWEEHDRFAAPWSM
jgi:aryl-alcohol dehydrogenase-like predicted oxidoreductase